MPRGLTTEHEWQADGAPGAGTGAGKDDTAVIQFYSKEKDDDPRFQGFGVVKEVSACGCTFNIGVPVPREPFSFGGWNESKFGVGDITGRSSIEFWTQNKKTTTKWNPEAQTNWMS